MTKLTVSAPLPPCAVYGDRLSAERLCDDMLSIGAPPREIILTDDCPYAAYRGVPVYNKQRIERAARDESVLILPASRNYGAVRAELRETFAVSRERITRDIAYLARAVTLADITDPPTIAEKTDATLIALQLGFVMGGVESWVANLYHEMAARGVNARIAEPVVIARIIMSARRFTASRTAR